MIVRFIADTHFGHANILRYDRRPWDHIDEHDAQLIENWNRVTRDEDLTYHLGFGAKQVHGWELDTPLCAQLGVKAVCKFVVPRYTEEVLVGLVQRTS